MKSFFNPLFGGTIILLMVGFGLLTAADAIQTQESNIWEGLEADLTRISIRNDILTLRFKIRNTSSTSHTAEFYFKDCYIVDAANQKKYFPLKDSEGQFIGGPKEKDWEGGRYHISINAGSSAGFWMKFPVPTDNPETIDISIPGFFPFEEVSLN
jgi:hypothetical protein